jgi:hypothetical protein
MATPQVITASTSGSTSSSAIQSTKVRVSVGAYPVYYAVGSSPTASSTGCEIIPAQTVRYINMQGLGNEIAFLAIGGASTVTVQQIGTVYASSIPGSTFKTA